MASKLKPRECLNCHKQFQPNVASQKFCSSKCQRQYYKKVFVVKVTRRERECLQCHKKFVTGYYNQKFCSQLCAINYKREECKTPKPEPVAKPERKSLSEWAREARECNLDYGTYRKYIEQGKTFDELKATVGSRPIIAHSRTHPVPKMI